MVYNIAISIVLYRTNQLVLKEVLESIEKCTLSYKVYLIDNSPTDILKSFRDSYNHVEYIFSGSNLGFGKAHNVAIRKSLTESKYHIVMNPDISFESSCLERLFEYMESNPEVGQVMPKVLYPSGEVQYLCKLLPTPMDLLFRRFMPWMPGAKERNNRYELRQSGYDKIMDVPYLSGCFMLFRTGALKVIGLFDERIFMYIEDADITRRMHMRFRTVYFPFVNITHNYEKGSYKKIKLMLYNVHGAFIYFNKWGWLVDSDRKKINSTVVKNYLE